MGTRAHVWDSPVSDGMAGAWLRSHPNSEQTNLADPTDATAQTVRYMCRLVQHSLSDPVVWAATNSALKLFAIAGSPCAAIWQWCKRSIKFVHHQDLLERWLGKGDELQLLISPEALLKMERPKGDCAVFTTLICAMLQTAGYKWEIVTVAVDPRQPGIYSHVFPRAILPDGRRLALDASHGKYPGWQVPAAHRTATQVWDMSGAPVADQASGFSGLHGYGGGQQMGMGCCGDDGLTGLRRGLGDDGTGDTLGDTLPVDYGSGGSYQILVGSDYIPTDDSSDYPYTSTLTPVASSSSSSTLTPSEVASINSAAAAWTKIASNVIAPQTTITTPSGLSISTPASQTGTLSSLLGGASSLTASSIGSYLPLILLGVAAVMILPALMGGKH
jgi:hypothetical protein